MLNGVHTFLSPPVLMHGGLICIALHLYEKTRIKFTRHIKIHILKTTGPRPKKKGKPNSSSKSASQPRARFIMGLNEENLGY